jgi:hypothetical protein
MADDEHNTTTTWEKRRRQITSPWNAGLSWGELVPKDSSHTVFLGHFGVRAPRHVLREIKQIADDRSWWRARRIRQPSPSFVVSEDNKEINKRGNGKAVKDIDEKELHGRTSYLRWARKRI